jgi:hypothetical protein
MLGGTPPCEQLTSLYPRGRRSGSGYLVPDPLGPSAPSQAHHNFIAPRLICDTFAVRERPGDPRVVPRFTAFLPSMSSPGGAL